MEAGRLGALLLQFPWSFRNTLENFDYVRRLADVFRDYPLILEVRHTSWNEPRVWEILGELQLGLCNIDQPVFDKSIAPAALVTSEVGYIRLHGRNYKSWWTENQNTSERYNYLYPLAELHPWIDRIQAVAESAKNTYVVTNNHYLGKAVVNATEISSILKGEPVAVPETLLQRYPELSGFACLPDQKSLYS